MQSVPFVFSTSHFQGPAFGCGKIVVIVALLEAIEVIPDKDYNFLGNEKFPNLYERLFHERKLKSRYLERRIYERPLKSEPFIENQSEHISKIITFWGTTSSPIFREKYLRATNLSSRIKASIFQNYFYINLRFLGRLKNKSGLLKKFLFKRTSSILILKSSAKNTRKTNSKRRNRIIFSLPDEILQRSEKKMKVVHQKVQKDDKNKAIVLRQIVFQLCKFSANLVLSPGVP